MVEKLKNNLKDLKKSKEFKEFKKKNPKAYLSSFVINVDGKKVGEWQIDYYLPGKHKIVTFVIKEKLEMRGEDDIFQKEKKAIEELKLDMVEIGFESMLKKLDDFKKKKYPSDFSDKAIVVLQSLDDKAVWNVTCLTSTLKVLNVKIDANDGKVLSDSIENFLSYRAS